MKKGMLHTILSLALVLMLALTPTLSLAAAPFGELTSALMAEAWNAGREINTRLSFKLLELSGDGLDDAETQQAMTAVSQLLDAAVINISAVALENGVRIEANAELSSQELVTGAVEITPELIAAETNVLPGKRFTVKVDDLMALTGMQMPTEEEIQQLLNMVLDYAMDAATRYGTVVGQWAEGVEIVQGPGAAATDTCDALAMTESFVITGTQVKALLVALFDEMLADETLISALNSLGMTDNRGNAYDMAHEIELSKQAVLEDTFFDAVKLTVALGYGDADLRNVLSLAIRMTVDNDPGVMFITAQTKTAEDGTQIATVAAKVNDGNNDLMNYEFAVTTATPDEATTTTAVSGTMLMDSSVMQPGADSANAVVTITANGTTNVTAESESMVMDEQMIMSIPNGTSTDVVTVDYALNATTDDLGDDFSTVYAYEFGMGGVVDGASLQMNFGFGAQITSSAYTPSTEATTEIDVLTLDDATMESLATEAESGAMQIAFTALSLLPADLMMLVMGQ